MNSIIKYSLLALLSITFTTTTRAVQSCAAACHYGTPKILTRTYKVTRHVGGTYAFNYKEGVRMTRRIYTSLGLAIRFA